MHKPRGILNAQCRTTTTPNQPTADNQLGHHQAPTDGDKPPTTTNDQPTTNLRTTNKEKLTTLQSNNVPATSTKQAEMTGTLKSEYHKPYLNETKMNQTLNKALPKEALPSDLGLWPALKLHPAKDRLDYEKDKRSSTAKKDYDDSISPLRT